MWVCGFSPGQALFPSCFHCRPAFFLFGKKEVCCVFSVKSVPMEKLLTTDRKQCYTHSRILYTRRNILLKKILVWLPLLLAVLLLCSCSRNLFTLDVLAQGEGGVLIEGDPLQKVPYGEEAVFTLRIPKGESVVQVFADDVLTDAYTLENNVLTMPDITSPCTIRIVSGVEKKREYWEADIHGTGGGSVVSNVQQGPVAVGSRVTLTAIPQDGAKFIGWSERFPLRSGGELLSEEEQLTVEITEFTFIIANFDTSGIPKKEEKPAPVPTYKTENTLTIYYNINGGDLINGSKVALETTFDTTYWDMPVAREDDGKLTRDGYVLLGYSYSPDGGELLRPGYRFLRQTDEKIIMLYCVWQKETDPSLFTVSDFNDTSVQIDKYNGTDPVVYIPRKIGGKKVLRIAEGAFAGNEHVTEVHITSSINAIEDGAFTDCPSLATITMYDAIQKVSDASFAGSPVKTLRLCAATTSRFANSYTSFGKKFERLVTTADQKRIVVVSGSSKYWGLDSDYMEELFGGEYAVVNYGTSVGMNILFFLEGVTSYLKEGDILVYCPEQYGQNAHHTNGNPELPSTTYQGISTSYNIVERVDMTRYTRVFDAYEEFSFTHHQMNSVSWDAYSSSMDRYGDYSKFRQELNFPDYLGTTMGQFRFDKTRIPSRFLPNMNRVLDAAAETGAAVLFSFPPHNQNAVLPEHLHNEEVYDSFMAFIDENVHARRISDLRNFVHEGQYFDDSDYHLGAVGRKFHTEQLARDLMAAGFGTVVIP
ncbi:MAG: hypothetical protein E7631_00745 [Ruminococcaceae bacterium]|nr:hypothetical protein [Oscillospiraceae bacterium]